MSTWAWHDGVALKSSSPYYTLVVRPETTFHQEWLPQKPYTFCISNYFLIFHCDHTFGMWIPKCNTRVIVNIQSLLPYFIIPTCVIIRCYLTWKPLKIGKQKYEQKNQVFYFKTKLKFSQINTCSFSNNSCETSQLCLSDLNVLTKSCFSINLNAFTFPRPRNVLVVSQPVKECNPRRASDMSALLF